MKKTRIVLNYSEEFKRRKWQSSLNYSKEKKVQGLQRSEPKELNDYEKNQIWEFIMKVNEYTFSVLGTLNLKKGGKKKDKNVQLMKKNFLTFK